MKRREQPSSRIYLAMAVFLLFTTSANGLDSVFYMWNDLVRNPELKEVDLLRVAQQSRIELQMLQHGAEVCQEFQPESKEEAEHLKNHITEIGRNVQEFLDRYTAKEIEALGAMINSMAQEGYERQKEEMPKVFREMGGEHQKKICSDLRTSILSMSPAIKVVIHK